MALDKIKQANKKRRHELRRKKLAKLHQNEDLRISRGDYKPIVDRHKRTLHKRRDHHRPMDGENKRQKFNAQSTGDR